MRKLERGDLWSLEQYAERRPAFRDSVIAHKRNRRLALDDHAHLYFEDRMTVRYQIQEMLRVERIFERDGIQDELDAYNPLIPDGRNWKATFMVEYEDVEERRKALSGLVGVEDRIWMQVDGHDRIRAIADEDLDRSTEEKTSSVHFVRFELDDEMVRSVKAGAPVNAGIDHPNLRVALTPIPANVRDALAADLD